VLSVTVAVVASVANATAIFAEPSNEVPPIVLAVVRVAALPDVFWLPALFTPGRSMLQHQLMFLQIL